MAAVSEEAYQKHLESGRKWYAANREKKLAKTRESYKKRMEKNPSCLAAHRRKRREWARKIKFICLARYSVTKITPMCSSPGCLITDTDMLAIDHVENNGFENRRARKHMGTGMYHHLIKSGFPEGYQVLCHNHNVKKELVRKRIAMEEKYGR